MADFIMFGKYSVKAVEAIRPKRTEDASNLIKEHGGEVKSMHAILGEKDLIFLVSFPGIEEAMKASIALSKFTKISFSTFPAVTVEEFDKLVG